MDELNPHAPHISDGDLSEKENPADNELGTEQEETEPSDWLRLAQEAFRFSTSWIDSNYRKRWEDSLRAFNNQHSLDSKYSSQNYDKRSKVYRPKMRSIIRKNEAAAAAAFFSNLDVVDIGATNQGDPQQLVSAEVMKYILQYRLTTPSKGIPWFQIVLGGLQDAQKTGAVCGKYYWDYEDGKTDKPCVNLIPIENLRIDPAADWMDPINSSPYVIELIPMYVGDVLERSQKINKKTGQPVWREVNAGELRQAISQTPSSTQIIREKGSQDPRQPEGRHISDYEIVWVQRHIHRKGGEDWEFYTLSDVAMLSDPQPLKESVFTGERNYVLGSCILETHTALASSVPELGKGLAEEANEIANQRLDNVKFVLNKRWLVARNKNVDLASLVRNVPGGITMADDPNKDIVESNWPDVTSSAYQEQDRINADLDELLGNFSSSSVLQNRQAMETPMRTLGMLNSGASMLTEYLLRTYTETFIEPLLRGLVKLEQKYETDLTIITIAAQKSQMFQRFGMNQITDQILNQELTIKVNVGMGATDPNTKLQKFMLGLGGYVNVIKNAPPGMNINEIGKEIFGLLGYQDGRRFMTTDDPQKQQLVQMLQMAFRQQQELALQVQNKHEANQVKREVEHKKIETNKNVAVAQMLNDRVLKAMDAHKDATMKASDVNEGRLKMIADGEKTRLDAQMKVQEMKGRARTEDAQRKQQDEERKAKEEERKGKLAAENEKLKEQNEKLKEQIAEMRKRSKGAKFKINRGKDGRAESVDILQ